MRFLALYVLFAATAFADLDLTPHPGVYEVEGAKFKNVYFLDGPKRVTYTPPRDWTYAGDSSSASFIPPGKAQATATIHKTTLTQPIVLNEDQARKLAEMAFGALPKGVTDAKFASVELNPLRINGNATCEVVLNYNFFGQACVRNIVFACANTLQLAFTLDCRRVDYEKLSKEFRDSLYSIQNL